MTTDFKPATQAKQLMLDFYAVVSLQVRGVEPGMATLRTANNEVDLAYYIRNQKLADAAMKARAAIIAAEQHRLLRDLPLINAAEIGHCGDGMAHPKFGTAEGSFSKRFGKVGGEWWKLFKKYTGSTSAEAHKPPPEFHGTGGYVGRYIGAMTASKMTGLSLVDVALTAFDKAFFGWGSAYGGPKWLKIAEAWRDLTEARTEAEIIHCIDIINALEHNTCTLFNKCEHYGGHGWVSEVLDLKFAASSPLSFVGRCSKELQPYILATREVLCALHPTLRKCQKARFIQNADGAWVELPTVAESFSHNAAAVKQLSNGMSFKMLYNGKLRTFSVTKVVKALDGSRQLMTQAKGWSLPKAGGITVTHFPFDEVELALWPSPVQVEGAGNPLFNEASSEPDETDEDDAVIPDKAAGAAHTLREAVVAAAKDLAVEGVHVQGLHNTGNVYRFRLTKEGEINCRYYIQFVDETFRLYFSHTGDEVDLSEATALSEKMPLAVLDDAEHAKKIATAIVQHADSVWDGSPVSYVSETCAGILSGMKVNPKAVSVVAPAKPKPAPAKSTFLDKLAPAMQVKSEASAAFEAMMQAQAGESADANTLHVKLKSPSGDSVVVHKDVYAKYLTVGDMP